jgi:hypothetical protein
VELAESRGHTDGQAQEACRLHRLAEQPPEWFAVLILIEYQQGPTGIVHEFQRRRGPRPVEFAPQFVLVAEVIEG